MSVENIRPFPNGKKLSNEKGEKQMFTWSEVGMFFAGWLFGLFMWRKEIVNGLKWIEYGKQAMRNQFAFMERLKK